MSSIGGVSAAVAQEAREIAGAARGVWSRVEQSHRNAPKRNNDFWFDDLDLGSKPRLIRCQLVWQRITIAWWSVLHHVGDKNVFAGELARRHSGAYRLDELREEFSRYDSSCCFEIRISRLIFAVCSATIRRLRFLK